MSEPSLNAAYALETPEDNLRLYRDWAARYNSDFAEGHGYVLPLRVAERFAELGGRGPVLDLGAWTGLRGEALQRLGVAPVDATDLSQEMLDVAGAKGVYRARFTGNMLERLPVADASYDGAVSSGTFTLGHVGPEALPEVLRILRPGGLCSLSINAAHFAARGFESALSGMDGQITDLTLPEVAIYREGAAGAHA